MAQTIKIHVLHTGYVKVDRGLPFHGLYRNPLAFTGLFRSEKNQVSLPVSSYLIEHPKGLILIDTGWNKQVRESNWSELGLQIQINKGYLPYGWAIDERLAALGYKTSDLDYVLLSHLHCDHVSGIKHVADAKKIFVSDVEWKAATTSKVPFVYLPREWEGVNIDTYGYSENTIGPFGKSFDLFGDGSIVQIYTPGHSAGLTSTRIQGDDQKFVLLASDVGYANRSWEEMLTPGICVNRNQAITSLAWVKEQAHDENCVEALANHDTKTNSHIIELPY